MVTHWDHPQYFKRVRCFGYNIFWSSRIAPSHMMYHVHWKREMMRFAYMKYRKQPYTLLLFAFEKHIHMRDARRTKHIVAKAPHTFRCDQFQCVNDWKIIIITATCGPYFFSFNLYSMKKRKTQFICDLAKVQKEILLNGKFSWWSFQIEVSVWNFPLSQSVGFLHWIFKTLTKYYFASGPGFKFEPYLKSSSVSIKFILQM